MPSVSERDVIASFTVEGMWPLDCRFVKLVTEEKRCAKAKKIRPGGASLLHADVVRGGLTVFIDESIHPSVRTQRVL